MQVSSNGGTELDAAPRRCPGLPPLSFVNDVEASLHDARTIFAVADAHKIGDFSPYVYVSTDLGRTWRSIAGDLPKGTIVVVDRSRITFVPSCCSSAPSSVSTGRRTAGATGTSCPAACRRSPFRDVKIHRRDNDLVGATFGRGFYVLDDYSPLREIAAARRSRGGDALPGPRCVVVRALRSRRRRRDVPSWAPMTSPPTIRRFGALHHLSL